jgi:hypothetical protein
MQAVQDEMETIHLYVVREQTKKPYTVLPLLCAFLCLLGIAAVTLYSAEHPYYEHERLTVPAKFLPLKVFTAAAPIIPTGVKTYSATTAHGTLTLTNGSVLSEVLPQGVIFNGVNGAEVQTEQSVFIPAGSAAGYGVATVPAKALIAGRSGNIQALAVNAVYGTALYVRNLTAFTGGRDAYSVTVQLPKDRQTAIDVARALVASQQAHVSAILANPCKEAAWVSKKILQLSWGCQYITYHVPSYMHVTSVHLSGKSLFIDVAFTPPPARMWVR